MPTPDLDRGRRQLIWSVASGTLVLVALGVSEYFRTGAFSALSLLGRPLIFAALGRLAFEGRGWAPKVAGVWIALLALVAGVNGVPALSTHPIAAVILFAFGLSYFLVGYRLIASPHIRAFVADRSARRSAQTLLPNVRCSSRAIFGGSLRSHSIWFARSERLKRRAVSSPRFAL